MKNLKKLYVCGGVAVVVIAAIIIAVIMSNKSNNDVSDYFKLKLEGPNGFANIDKHNGIEGTAKLKKIIRDKNNTGDYDTEEYEDKIIETTKFEYNKKRRYSNGDIVKVKADFDENTIEEMGIDLKDGSFELEVSGLPKPEKVINPLEHGKLKFEGASPSLELVYEPDDNDDYLWYLDDINVSIKIIIF